MTIYYKPLFQNPNLSALGAKVTATIEGGAQQMFSKRRLGMLSGTNRLDRKIIRSS